jgi:hypothetical protein
MVVLMLALVCVAGVAGAALFRDRLRDIPGVSDLPGIGGNPSGIAPPPVQTGSATVGSGQAAAISMPNGPMIEVPHGAVPPNPDGTPGTLTFSSRPRQINRSVCPMRWRSADRSISSSRKG